MKYNNKKYKVVNAKVNKQLINDELELEPIRSKGPSILQQILDRLDKIDNRLDGHTKHFDKQDEFNKKIETILNEHGEVIDHLDNKLNNVIRLNSLKH